MRVWDFNGITVWSTVQAELTAQSFVVRGLGREYMGISVEWEAVLTTHGWLVTLIWATGKKEQFQGATFNLALEVARALERS